MRRYEITNEEWNRIELLLPPKHKGRGRPRKDDRLMLNGIPLLECLDLSDSNVLADRGYDSWKIVDFIYQQGGEPTIPSRKSNKIQRKCDWWLYKERHLVECFFQKIKWFRRISARFDKLDSSFLGFVLLAAIALLVK